MDIWYSTPESLVLGQKHIVTGILFFCGAPFVGVLGLLLFFNGPPLLGAAVLVLFLAMVVFAFLSLKSHTALALNRDEGTIRLSTFRPIGTTHSEMPLADAGATEIRHQSSDGGHSILLYILPREGSDTDAFRAGSFWNGPLADNAKLTIDAWLSANRKEV